MAAAQDARLPRGAAATPADAVLGLLAPSVQPRQWWLFRLRRAPGASAYGRPTRALCFLNVMTTISGPCTEHGWTLGTLPFE